LLLLNYCRSDVFVMGCANSGKSTFVNQLIRHLNPTLNEMSTTTSPIPGTTLSIVSIPLKNNCLLYDTPGIHNSEQIFNYMTPDELTLIIPKKQIKPIVYAFKPGYTMFIGGLIRIDYLLGPPILYFTTFLSSELYVHRTNTTNAEDFYQRQLGRLLKPPINVNARANASFPSFVKNEWSLNGTTWREAAADVVFSGLGWISLTVNGNILFNTWAPQGVGTFIRHDPLMPFETPKKGQRVSTVVKLGHNPKNKNFGKD